MFEDSNEDIFITQSHFMDSPKQEITTDGVLSDALDLDNEKKPTFSLRCDLFSDISSDEMTQITQAVEKVEKDNKTQFAEPMKERDLLEIQKASISTYTERKTKWAMNVFNNWLQERQNHARFHNYSI